MAEKQQTLRLLVDSCKNVKAFHALVVFRYQQSTTQALNYSPLFLPILVSSDSHTYFLKSVALMPFTPEQLLVMGAHERERSVAFESCEQTRHQGLPELELYPDQETQMAPEEFWKERRGVFLKRRTFSLVG